MMMSGPISDPTQTFALKLAAPAASLTIDAFQNGQPQAPLPTIQVNLSGVGTPSATTPGGFVAGTAGSSPSASSLVQLGATGGDAGFVVASAPVQVASTIDVNVVAAAAGAAPAPTMPAMPPMAQMAGIGSSPSGLVAENPAPQVMSTVTVDVTGTPSK